jgi:Tol biopolymer transport system component
VNARHFPIRNVKAWTPDGQGLAYVGQPRSANVWIAPIDGTTSRQITWFSGRAISSVAWSSDGRRLAVTRVMTLADLELLAAFR